MRILFPGISAVILYILFILSNFFFCLSLCFRVSNEIGVLADSFNRMVSHLENSYAKINAVVTNAMDGIITIHVDGRIDTFNPAAERIFGYKADELVGKNISLLMPEPYRSEHDDHIQNYLRTGIEIGLLFNFGATRLEYKRKTRTPTNPNRQVEHYL